MEKYNITLPDLLAQISLLCLFLSGVSYAIAMLTPIGHDGVNQKAVDENKKTATTLFDFSKGMIYVAVMALLYGISPWLCASVLALEAIHHFWGSKMPIFFLLLLPTLMSAQTKTSEIKSYLGERYNSVAAAGNWDFYFQTTTIIRKSDGTKTFPQLLAGASNWSDGTDGKLEQIRCNGKLYTDMRKQQAQDEKAAIKTRMVGNTNLDSLKIADGVQNIVENGPIAILQFWASEAFKYIAVFFIALINLFFFFTSACLNETKINRIGVSIVGRWMYIVGSWFSGIQNLIVISVLAFCLVTFFALILTETFWEFVTSSSMWYLFKTALCFGAGTWAALQITDWLTPEPPTGINEDRIGININGGNALPQGKFRQ